jgi:hypothetical protein
MLNVATFIEPHLILAAAATYINLAMRRSACRPPCTTIPELSRFEMDDDGVLAVVNYRLADHLITFTHTEVPPQASIFTFPSDQILPAYKNRDPAASFASVAEFIITHRAPTSSRQQWKRFWLPSTARSTRKS